MKTNRLRQTGNAFLVTPQGYSAFQTGFYCTMVLIGMLLATGTLKAQQDVFRIAFLTNLGFTTVPGAFCDYKINNAGQVIGTIGTVDQQAAIWANGSITKMLGYYPGAKNGVKYSDGIAINDSGLVAGQCNDINNNVFAMVN